MAKTPHWTYRKTAAREALITELRELLNIQRPDEGERIHGQLTDAQVLDWALEELRWTLVESEYVKWADRMRRPK